SGRRRAALRTGREVPRPKAEIAPELRGEPATLAQTPVEGRQLALPTLDQEPVPVAPDLRREAGGVQRPRPLQFARPFGAEPGELEQPCALAGAQQELAPLEVGVARRPVRLAPVAERAPASAGELLERRLCRPDQIGEPAVQPVLRATRRADQEIAQFDRVRP